MTKFYKRSDEALTKSVIEVKQIDFYSDKNIRSYGTVQHKELDIILSSWQINVRKITFDIYLILL